ncbi:hypothetical protein PSECIP111951_00687 [Pseudoalteromonas holothuriae]|uniref:Polysaccharide biosynthesis protein n=1 Tax=Pseudoalteromonas holothuriae TaxID=2963714 RepID=A0A9W4VQ49_9GAMM|nr:MULTISPECIES: oligosaccharide flippase family protein [unclassified Pseudoalteromonas]CAH9052778.1 hypothetical protein PSECIP111951_00687 [Pseudoalteromonas sp. CIP111951]CAH9056744.1 hypothetical protein PSECIP111854_01855 [Pseudoalteromonas sp. CIP111854]
MSLKTLVSYALGPIGASLLGLITLPILTRLIVPDVYAQIALAQITIQLLLFYALSGFDQAFMREYYEQENKQKLFCHTYFMSLVLFSSIIAIFYVFRDHISAFLFGDYRPEVLAIIVITLLFTITLRYLQLIMRLENKAMSYSLALFLQALFNLLFIIIFVEILKVSSLIGVLLANGISVLIVTLGCWFKARQNIAIFSTTHFDKVLFGQLFKYAFPLLFSTLLMWVLYSADQYMLRWLSNYNELGIYAAAYKLCAALTILQVIISTYWVPLSLKWHQAAVPTSQFNLAGKAATTLMIIVFLLSVALRDIVSLLLGEQFALAVDIFPFLMLYPIFYALSEISGVGINLSRKTSYMIYITLLSAIFNITINLWLIPKLGAKGAAIATGATFILYFYSRTILANRVWKKVAWAHYNIMVCLIVFILLFIDSAWIEWFCGVLASTLFIFLAVLYKIGKLEKIYMSN